MSIDINAKTVTKLVEGKWPEIFQVKRQKQNGKWVEIERIRIR